MGKVNIRPIFLTNRISATLIIPIELARAHGLTEHAHVVVEDAGDGILIRKLEIEHKGNESIGSVDHQGTVDKTQEQQISGTFGVDKSDHE